MRRLMVLLAFGLLLIPLVPDRADARPGFRGGGVAFRGGFARPGFAGAGFVRPGWRGAGAGGWRPGWGPGWGRPGWLWAAAGLGLATAAVAAAPYSYGYAPYGYYNGYDYGSYGGGYGPYAAYNGCVSVPRSVWTGYGYQVVLVNSCGY